MTLRDLSPGDFFFPASQVKQKTLDIFQVAGNGCEFNQAAGTATRKCIEYSTGLLKDKQCRLEVMPCEEPKAKKPDSAQPQLF